MKKSYLLSLIFISFSLFIFSLALSLFTSCAPSTTTPGTTSPPKTPPATETSEVECEKDSDDKTELCSERENKCEKECEIHTRSELSRCEELTVHQARTNAGLFEILEKGESKELENLFEKDDEGEEEYELKDLKCLLSIGGKGWIEEIDSGFNSDKAKNTLEWLVDDKDVALALLEDNDGDEILEALLLKAFDDGTDNYKNISSDTGANTNYTEPSDQDISYGLWKLVTDTSNVNLDIYTKKNASSEVVTETIGTFDDSETEIYEALSYFILNDNNDNIFSYAAEEENQSLFNLAFSVLSDTCDAVTDDEEAVACKRALLCWTANQTKDSSTPSEKDIADEEIWELADEYKDDLKEGSEHDECSAKHFYEIFN